MESLRLFCGVSQVAVWQGVAFFPSAVVEGGQRQVLDKQLLRRNNNVNKGATSVKMNKEAAMFTEANSELIRANSGGMKSRCYTIQRSLLLP